MTEFNFTKILQMFKMRRYSLMSIDFTVLLLGKWKLSESLNSV